MAKRPRPEAQVSSPGGPDDLLALKKAYLAAVDGDTPPDQCELLHHKILNARRAKRALQSGGITGASAGPAVPGSLAHALASASGALPEGLAGELSNLSGAVGGQQPLAGLAVALGNQRPTAGAPTAILGDGPRLFVEGLPIGTSSGDLKALVEQVHSIPEGLDCVVFPGLPCGVVSLGTSQALAEAVANLHNRRVQDWPEPLQVRVFNPQTEDPLAPYRLQQQLLQQLQEQQAELQLQEAQLAQLATAGTGGMLETLHNLFGSGEVTQALAGLGDVKLEPAGPDEENSVVQTGLNPKKLFIGQIRRDFSHVPSLQALFEPFGPIVNFRFLEDKGVAYVEFAEFVSAKNACKQLHGKDIQGISTKIGLNVKFSKR